MTLAVPRALYAFGRDGFLPRIVGRVHPEHRTPDVAIWVQSAIVCALAISGQFEKLAIIANLATLVLYGACCVAAWQLRRRGVRLDEGRPMRVPMFGIAPLLALAVIAYMLSSITLDEWAVVGGVLVAAAVIFAATRGHRKSLPARAA
jgi:amino acid transporter